MIEQAGDAQKEENHERCNDPRATEPDNEPYQGERYQHRSPIAESPLA